MGKSSFKGQPLDMNGAINLIEKLTWEKTK